MNPLVSTLLIALVPAIAVLVLWSFLRKGGSRGEVPFLLGFLAISLFYIFAPDPALVYGLYAQDGDTGPVWVFSAIALVFLAAAVFIFKSHRGGRT